MSAVLTHTQLPPGYSSVSPFVAISGEEGALGFVAFVCDVFEATETLAAHAVDADGLLIHAELRLGDATIMVFDSKPDWPFTPALLQVYVSDAEAVLERSRAAGAEVITAPTEFFGGQRLARLRDRWGNLWWLFEYGPDSRAPSEQPNELPGWRPDPDAPESYSHATLSAGMRGLTSP
jgi:PhnB protein